MALQGVCGRGFNPGKGRGMKITRAQATDGRVFQPLGEGWQVVGKAPLADVSRPLARILRPQAAYRWLLPQLSAITPQYIEMVLRGALAGNHVQQWELFDLMLDTWPELAACAQELTDGVMERKLIFEAFAEEEEDATPTAQERCKLASAALRRMRPDAAADENDLEATIKDILDGWFRGVTCLEVDWQTVTSGVHGQFIAPRATFWVHPVCFAFDQNGRIGLRVDAAGQMQPLNLAGMSLQPQPAVLGAFPPHKFLIGIHKAKSGTALGGSLLRPLAWWWCAANFSADWILNLAQVFGLPFRWANYDPFAPQATVDAICTMLQNMGSAGWAAFPTGTTLELKEAGSLGADHSPQGELLDRADRYARLVILGQTMSGSQDSSKGGGKAFGAVESDVKARRINAAAKYACSVLNTQLIPSILTLNYGDADEAPCVRLLEDKEGDLSEAQRDKVLADAGLEIPKGFLRKKYGLPAPVDGEASIGGRAVGEDLDAKVDEWDEDGMSAGDGTYHGNQYEVVAPAKIDLAQADAMLDAGFSASASDGSTVKFGERLKNKLAKDPRRKAYLLWAKAAVEHGKPDISRVDGEERKVFAAVFKDKGRSKGFLTIVDVKDGEAFNIHRKDVGAIRRGKHVKGRQAGGQPPEPIRGPITAARRHANFPQGNPTVPKINRLRELVAIEDDAVFARELGKLVNAL